MPAEAELGEDWQLVVGVYNPQTGERLPLSPSGQSGEANAAMDELDLGSIRVIAPPEPDQACALLPAACPSQQN